MKRDSSLDSPLRFTYILVQGGHAYEALALAARLHGTVTNSYLLFKGDRLTRAHLPSDHDVGEITHTIQEYRRLGWLQRVLGLMKALPAFVESLLVLHRFRSDAVISTGSGPAFIPMVAAKLMGKKVIYIESACRIHSPSLCGWIAYQLVADLFIVQWNECLRVYPKAYFGGRLF